MRHGAGGFLLEGATAGEARTELVLDWRPEGRTRTVNGKAASLARHLGALPVVSWSAEDAELVSGPPAKRRRFLDQGVVGMRPAAIDSLARYRRALDQKRELLVRGGRGLASWNEVLATAAVELVAARRAYAEQLGRRLSGILEELDAGLPAIRLRYLPSLGSDGEDPAAALAALERARPREIEGQKPLLGPHRDELEIGWGGRAARRVASAGERKLLGLALAAARGRVLADSGRPPVYLLDDLDAELDRARLESAWRLFRGVGQAFATSNRAALGGRLEGVSEWRLEPGAGALARGA